MKLFSRILVYTIPLFIITGCFVDFFGNNGYTFMFSILMPVVVILNIIMSLFFFIRRDKRFKYSLLALVVFFICFDSFFQFNSESSLEDSNSLDIITYNTQGFFSNKKDEEIVDFIEKNQPDIILFQEFSAVKFNLFKKKYPYWIKTNRLAPHKSVMAIFSKYPIMNKKVIEFPNSHNIATYVDILFNKEHIRLYNLHLESFKVKMSSDINEGRFRQGYKNIIRTQEKQREQIQILQEHIKEFDGKVIICGDLNSTQYSTAYRAFKKERIDTFIEKGKGLGATYSLFGYPLRLDFILVDKGFDVLSHENFKLKFSDHEPVMARLKLN